MLKPIKFEHPMEEFKSILNQLKQDSERKKLYITIGILVTFLTVAIAAIVWYCKSKEDDDMYDDDWYDDELFEDYDTEDLDINVKDAKF